MNSIYSCAGYIYYLTSLLGMWEYVFKFVFQCVHVFLYLFRDFQRERLNDFVDVLWLMVMFVCNVHTAQNTLSKNDSTHSELIMGTMLHIPTIWRTHEFYHTRIFLRRYMSSKCARITSNTSAYYISFHQDHQYLHKKKCVLLKLSKQFFEINIINALVRLLFYLNGNN